MSTGFGAFLMIYGSQLLVQIERITTSAPKTLEILIVSCRGFELSLILNTDQFDHDSRQPITWYHRTVSQGDAIFELDWKISSTTAPDHDL